MAQLYYRSATINYPSQSSPTTDLTDYPLLISVTLDKTHVASANGYDIRPYTDSGLSSAITGYELESYNSSTGDLLMWVKISSMSHTTPGVIYLGYGDSSLTTDASSSTTWNSNYVAVYHFGTPSSLSLTDSTSNGFNLTNHGATAGAGQIGGALNSNGTAQDAVTSGSVAVGGLNGQHTTFQAWIHATTADTAYREIIRLSSSSPFLLQNANGQWNYTASGGYYNQAGGPASTTTGNHLLHGTNDNTTTTNYYDGALNNSYSEGGTITNSAPIAIACESDQSQLWAGWIDEARILKTDVSADWAMADYNSQKASSTFVTYGSETPVGGGGSFLPKSPIIFNQAVNRAGTY